VTWNVDSVAIEDVTITPIEILPSQGTGDGQQMVITGTPTVNVAGTPTMVGPAAHSAATSGAPVRVGGKAAIEVGKRLHQLSKQAQVIVVTHLPQVAAWADTHFVVKKSSDGSVVASGVAKVQDADRVEEIARMLAGLEESTSAREHASELLALRG
jgi:hypothetical protein